MNAKQNDRQTFETELSFNIQIVKYAPVLQYLKCAIMKTNGIAFRVQPCFVYMFVYCIFTQVTLYPQRNIPQL